MGEAVDQVKTLNSDVVLEYNSWIYPADFLKKLYGFQAYSTSNFICI